MAAFLYENANGRRVTTNSYSAGSLYHECPRKYKYQRLLGWKEKTQRAAMEFGNAWEAAIQTYHLKLDLGEARAEWAKGWTSAKSMELAYKDSESWSEMFKQGDELLRLYALRLPDLPISNPRFQLNFKKEVFPDSEYAGIEDTSFIDMLVEEAPNDHVLLPPARPGSKTRPLLIDIKTSGLKYPQDARMLRLDPQLRRYSWTTGIETVAFLVGVKNSRSLERGNYVTLLTNTVAAKAGDTYVVFDGAETEFDLEVVLLTEEQYKQYTVEQKDIRGNALKAIKARWMEEGFVVSAADVTRQAIQFLCTVVTGQEREETGESVGREVLEICASTTDNFWPQHPGVRFPSNRCVYCSYLGLCIGDENKVKDKLVNITNLAPAAPNPREDWLEEME